ncbi:MAG: bifunctional folylpolyglutamate synthase/dihydrofolate synthase [Phycisphaerales bacterium]
MIRSYSAALKYLYDHVDVERMRVIRSVEETFKLDRTRALLERLDRPQDSLRLVHIAGTKGKGSTVAMLSAMTRGCGLAVGEFTSPHLVDLRERIRVNGEIISESDLTESVRAVATAADAITEEFGRPHFFELLTAMGLLHFAKTAVDLAIIEVGLGGRLDCTNVILPEVVGITRIGFDHTHILGRTLPEIAREKAGIFKRGVPAISTPQEPEVVEALRRRAEEVGCELKLLDADLEFSQRFESSKDLGPHSRIGVTTKNAEYEHVAVPLFGEHQAMNCGLALAIVDALRNRGFQLPHEQIEAGLATTRLEGRMELIRTKPRVLIDGAHNEESIRALVRAIGAHVPYDSLVVIFGCGQDKDIDGMLRAIATGADKIIFTKARNNPRAADPDDLKSRFVELSGKMTQTAPTLMEAFELARRAVTRDDLVCVTGSFYLAGEAKKRLSSRTGKSSRPAVVTRGDQATLRSNR